MEAHAGFEVQPSPSEEQRQVIVRVSQSEYSMIACLL